MVGAAAPCEGKGLMVRAPRTTSMIVEDDVAAILEVTA
jgi:hypothetical protein